MYILGIDQGIANMGYSILNDDKLITYGCINTNSNDSLEERFFSIYSQVKILIEEFKPEIICCEKLFYTSPKAGNRNKSASIIYTNMITGVLTVLAGEFKIELRQFVPSKVKKAICNDGKAQKDDVISKIKSMYNVDSTKTKYEHVCDSIAIAYTCYSENISNPEIHEEHNKSQEIKIEKIQKAESLRLKKIDKERNTLIRKKKREEKLRLKMEKERNKVEKTEKSIGKKE